MSDKYISKEKFIRRNQPIEFRRFTTNNEVESPEMDSIVNWMNKGSQHGPYGWHNGTDIFILDNDSNDEWVRVSVGQYIVKDEEENDSYKCYTVEQFCENFVNIG